MNHEQLERLSRDLQLSIEVDHSGWLQEPMHVRFIRGPGHTLCPTAIQIRSTEPIETCVAESNILGRCSQYNRFVEELRRLQARCSHVVAKETGKLDLQSPLMRAFTTLQNLDAELVRRQALYMGNNTVTPKVSVSALFDGDAVAVFEGIPVPVPAHS
jgi:hypothetical protein